jgi:hypothetical protein
VPARGSRASSDHSDGAAATGRGAWEYAAPLNAPNGRSPACASPPRSCRNPSPYSLGPNAARVVPPAVPSWAAPGEWSRHRLVLRSVGRNTTEAPLPVSPGQSVRLPQSAVGPVKRQMLLVNDRGRTVWESPESRSQSCSKACLRPRHGSCQGRMVGLGGEVSSVAGSPWHGELQAL